MITLKADQRDLSRNRKYSYSTINHLSARNTYAITNSDGFSADDYVLIGEWGSETSEIMQIGSVNTSTHVLTFKAGATTKFAHSESTKITTLGYNQVRFYQTATATFSATNPVTGYIDLQPDSFFSKAYDTSNTTGFGWFIFYNETTAKASSNSNAIPYGDFDPNSVKKILDAFYSLLNNKEIKLVTEDDSFTWLDEAYSTVQNRLNLVNKEFTTSDEYDIDVSSGTKEYSLPTGFSDLISVYHGTDRLDIDFIPLGKVPDWDANNVNTTKYYLRGSVIGFSPTPTESETYTIRYTQKTTKLTSYYDSVNLPDNNFYLLIDYMLYKASHKLGRGDGKKHKEDFKEKLDLMLMVSHKRDSNKDTWGIDDQANI